MKHIYYTFVAALTLISAHTAWAETAPGVTLEQVKPGSMRVHKADAVAATPATPVKKVKAKNAAEAKELLREGVNEAATPAAPVASTPLSGLSDDPSTLYKERALQGR